MCEAFARGMASRTLIATCAVVLMIGDGRAQVPEALVAGRTLELHLVSGGVVTGELIDVTDASLRLRVGTVPYVVLPTDEVDRVRLQRHRWTTGRNMGWVGLGALISGAGLGIACSSVEDGSCGGVPVLVGLWGVVGGLFAAVLGNSAWETLPVLPNALRPYARFPQGAPLTGSGATGRVPRGPGSGGR